MPRVARALKPIDLPRLPPGRHAVGGVPGLLLQVPDPQKPLKDRRVRTQRAWVLRVSIAGKRRDIGLGGFPEVGLAEARERARKHRESVFEGRDPVEEKKSARSALQAHRSSALTFKQVAEKFLEINEGAWSNAKHAAQWRNTLETYVFPTIGNMVVRDISASHVLAVLEPIWREKTETAKRVRGRIESVLDYARVRGYRSGENPARWKGHLDHTLPRPSKITRVVHHAALPYAQAPGLFANLLLADGMGAKALSFAIVTACRSGEVRGATWREFDLEAGLWTVPAARMKAGREHRVPLSVAALGILRALPRGEPDAFVFPGAKGGQLSDMTLTAVLHRMKVNATAHGFRSTFRDWIAECTNFPNEVAEMALAHAIANESEAAYRRGDLFEKRRQMMSEWGAFLMAARRVELVQTASRHN